MKDSALGKKNLVNLRRKKSARCDQMTDPASALDWEIIKKG